MLEDGGQSCELIVCRLRPETTGRHVILIIALLRIGLP